MYEQVLTLLDSQPTRPSNKDSMIEIFAIEGVAHARLHQFPQAEKKLGLAVEMCQASPEVTCGDAIRARGVLAVQHGQIDTAKQFFGQSLQFARAHHDQFLEETALLNLGLTSLREGHFDEAIDWTNAAYQASATLEAGGEAQAALGNLGWAYYNLGDSERSLGLSLEAENRAIQAGDAIDQLYWTTNVGYVYAERGDVARAKESYLKALDLATKIGGKEGIYNALRALALVSAERGELEEARKYSDDAIAIAGADNNRLNELYPLLVKALIAARSHDGAEAERIFREVERDQKGNASLKWRADHGLARLYEDEHRADDADRAYRAALATFEAARSSLRGNDSKLPFSNNASRIYDDYIHFLVACGKTNDALRWADYSRARTLAEGLGLLAAGASAGPPALNMKETARGLKGVLLFYWLGEKQSYLWAITPQKTSLFPLPPGSEIDAAVKRYRDALAGPQDVLDSANPDGRWLYRTLVAPAQALLRNYVTAVPAAIVGATRPRRVMERLVRSEAEGCPRESRHDASVTSAKVFIIPDGSLNSLNFETLIVSEPKLHYWIEDAIIADASSLRVLAASHFREKKRARRLLLVGDSIAPSKEYPELPKAALQMESVAKHFPGAGQRVLSRGRATPTAYLDSDPAQFSHIHFVAHGTASRLSPLDSAIVLSKGDAENGAFKLYARDIIRHRLQADLVTISACYGAGERSYSGEGLVGLSWAFLRAGAHNVIAALWEATDASTAQLMDKFYDELDRGAPPDLALRDAKLSLLHGSGFRNPFYWAPFQLYAGS
ncbi:MAG: CHAT domain-containing protein [Acidobacteriia bacterium]|nr:CHAT domain-containing protein [Terriglobia bacterium]